MTGKKPPLTAKQQRYLFTRAAKQGGIAPSKTHHGAHAKGYKPMLPKTTSPF